MVATEDSHLSAPYRPALVHGPWFESAVFRVGLGGGQPTLRLDPIELDADSQPVVPGPGAAASILARLAASSKELDPSIVVDGDGTVRRHVVATV
jgi:poly-gamma-glutamate synthesis protein (capsule biosynthesis protein)